MVTSLVAANDDVARKVSMMFRVAHISDVHISAPQGVLRALRWHDAFEAKRVLGAINVLWRRGPNVYSPQVLEAAVQDMKTQGTFFFFLLANALFDRPQASTTSLCPAI